jgi:hypothetical protein
MHTGYDGQQRATSQNSGKTFIPHHVEIKKVRVNKNPSQGQIPSKDRSNPVERLAHRCAVPGFSAPLRAPAPKTALPFCRTGGLIQISRHGQIKNPAQGRVFYLWRW